jgi:retron-type reverse transcriptase
VNWILDADIRSFFDSVSQEWLVRFLEHRIGDNRIIRLVRKWLKAGVLEDGEWSVSEEGTPQGAVVSPLLANVYLHYTFDLWADRWRRREAKGNIIILRYADDSVPRTHDLKSGECDAAREMRAGPSKPACRSRLQTTLSCMGQESVW